MDYTIAEASISDVEAIVDVTFQSFEDAFNKPFYFLDVLAFEKVQRNHIC